MNKSVLQLLNSDEDHEIIQAVSSNEVNSPLLKSLGIEIVLSTSLDEITQELLSESYSRVPDYMIIKKDDRYFRSDFENGSYYDTFSKWVEVECIAKTITTYEYKPLPIQWDMINECGPDPMDVMIAIDERTDKKDIWLRDLCGLPVMAVTYYEELPSQENYWETRQVYVIKWGDKYFIKTEQRGSYGATDYSIWRESKQEKKIVTIYNPI